MPAKKHTVYIKNSQSLFPVTSALRAVIRKAVIATLDSEAFDAMAEVSVTLVDNIGIRALNREYRGRDAVTDVLSFPLYEADEDIEVFEDEPAELGDIAISLERAAVQAEEIGNTFECEIAFLCVHSVLHLLGWDHETGEDDESSMIAEQKKIMALLFPEKQK